MSMLKKSLLTLGSIAALGMIVAMPLPASAQANPCAPKASKAANPCAPKAKAATAKPANPCAPKAGNPCAPKK